MLLLLLTPSLLVAAVSCFAKFHVHDATFSPDAILRVTRGNMTLGGGVERYTTMVNGSVPGPALCFHENQVRWVRVYNDLVDANLTMVSDPHDDQMLSVLMPSSSTGTASLNPRIPFRTALHSPHNGLSHRFISSIMSSRSLMAVPGRIFIIRMSAFKRRRRREG